MKTRRIIGSAFIGAGLMYLFDRQAGNRRRAIIQDKAVHGANVIRDGIGKVSRDARNRLKGISAELKHVVSKEEVSDRVLVERVRSYLGTLVSHPSSIYVEATDGHVMLTGTVPAEEADNLLKKIKSVRGVRDVAHDLEVHEEPSNVPGLQGESARRSPGGKFELMQENWSPAARLFTGLAGGALIAYGLGKRRIPGAVMAALPILARAVTNMPLRRIVGASGRRGVDIQKTINIDAPVEKVFHIFSRVEEFPNFMTHVQKVSRLGKGRYRWTVAGPAGVTVNWDSVLTSIEPNRQLAWRTEPGSMVKHAGIVKFQSNPDGGTAVNVQLTYNPLVGGIGHAFLTLLGGDPKTLLDEDLLRAKTFLETEEQPHDAAATSEVTA